MQTAIIVDIDGTLADTRAYAGAWKEGVRNAAFGIRADVVDMVRQMADTNIVVICTARTVDMLDATMEWLYNNDIPCDILRMQTTWGNVPEYKARVVEEITNKGFEITHSFDDESSNNEMFEDFGFITVVEV